MTFADTRDELCLKGQFLLIFIKQYLFFIVRRHNWSLFGGGDICEYPYGASGAMVGAEFTTRGYLGLAAGALNPDRCASAAVGVVVRSGLFVPGPCHAAVQPR